MYVPVWNPQLALELEALAQTRVSKYVTPQHCQHLHQYHINLSVPGPQGESAWHGNTVCSTQATSAQRDNDAPGSGCADTANTIYPATGLGCSLSSSQTEGLYTHWWMGCEALTHTILWASPWQSWGAMAWQHKPLALTFRVTHLWRRGCLWDRHQGKGRLLLLSPVTTH